MSEIQTATIATLPANTRREIRVVQDDSILSNLLDTARYEHLLRLSQMMATSSLLPAHLRHVRGDSKLDELPQAVQNANCFRVVNQALRWGMDPFSIIDETYVVGGKLAYSGKLVAGVVNARANLKHRLRFVHSGEGQNLMVTVAGTFEGEDEERTVELRLGDAKTNNQMWSKDPHQKLIYSAAVKWARRHCPEVLLGVITEDDLERMANQPTPPVTSKLTDRLNGLPQLPAAEPTEPKPADPSPAPAEPGPAKVEASAAEVGGEVVDNAAGQVADVATSYSNFLAAVRGFAAANDVANEVCEQAILKMPTAGMFVKSSQANVGPYARKTVWEAIQHGAFDWATGKVAD